MSQTPTLPPSPPREPLFERLWRFGRALIVGAFATLADQTVLSTAIRVFGVAPVRAAANDAPFARAAEPASAPVPAPAPATAAANSPPNAAR
jgi:hypothetical protein